MISTVLLGLAALQGSAPMLSSHDPQTIVRYMQSEGFRAQLTTDKLGDPMIRSASGGTGFNVLFYGCKEHRQCADLQFQVAWDYTKNNPTAAAINQWNAKKRFTKVYLDGENDPFLEMDVIFTEGRMSGAAFGEHLDLFVESMGNFEKEFGWKQDAPTPAALPASSANHISR